MWSSRQTVLEGCFEKFSTTTVIRVFNFIRTAPFLVERIFWILIFVGFTSVTVWDISQTIQKFLSEPTASIVSFPVANRDGLNVSNMTLCVSMNETSLLALYDKETLVDEIVAAFASTANITEHLRLKLDNHRALQDKLACVHSPWNVDDVAADAQLLAYFEESDDAVFTLFNPLEVALLGLTTSMLADIIEAENIIRQTRQTSVFKAKMAEKLYRFYTSRHTDFAELLQLTAEAICVLQRFHMIVRHRNADTGLLSQSIVNVCKRDRVKYFGKGLGGIMELTCYRLAAEELLFFSAFDTVTITARIERLYGDLARTVENAIVDLVGTLSLESGQAPFQAPLNQKQNIFFKLDTWSTSLSLRRSPCLDARRGSLFECSASCRSELIMRECNCMPLINEFARAFKADRNDIESCAGQSDLSSLVYVRNKRCREALATTVDATRTNCTRRCDRECTTMLYSSTLDVTDSVGIQLPPATNVSTVIRLWPRQFVYERVVEYRTMDERQLITSLGGNLSLYLGASFLALIHIVVFFVKLPFDVTGGGHTKAPVSLTETKSTAGTGGNFDDAFAALVAEQLNWRRSTDCRLDRIEKQVVDDSF